MALKLEVFETAETPASTAMIVMDTSALDEARLASYEAGYTAGWEDAAAAQSDDQARMRADLARNLQALNFTYQEARMHVLRSLEPLLLEVTGRLLPEIARASLGPVIMEALMPIAEDRAGAPISLVLNPASRPPVEALMDPSTALPLQLVDEPTLSEGQAYLRCGDVETQIDLDRAIAGITTALRDFYDISTRDCAHG